MHCYNESKWMMNNQFDEEPLKKWFFFCLWLWKAAQFGEKKTLLKNILLKSVSSWQWYFHPTFTICISQRQKEVRLFSTRGWYSSWNQPCDVVPDLNQCWRCKFLQHWWNYCTCIRKYANFYFSTDDKEKKTSSLPFAYSSRYFIDLFNPMLHND